MHRCNEANRFEDYNSNARGSLRRLLLFLLGFKRINSRVDGDSEEVIRVEVRCENSMESFYEGLREEALELVVAVLARYVVDNAEEVGEQFKT